MSKKKLNPKSGPKPSPKKIIFKTLISIITSVLLISFISITYFLTLISTEYKSFPFVTHKIEEVVNRGLSDGLFITIGQSSMKFDDFHRIKIKIHNVKLTNSNNNQESVLPETELEFSIFKLALFKIIPSKIKIIGPTIDIDQTSDKAKIAINGIDSGDNSNGGRFFEDLSKIFLSLKDGSISISKFYIIDGTINVKTLKETKVITLRRSQISSFFSDGYLKLESQNDISLNTSELSVAVNCDFKKSEGLKCDVDFTNLIPSLLAPLDPQIAILKKIKGSFDGKINFLINENYQISSASFNVTSSTGSFELPEYFKSKISFQNLAGSGKIDNVLKTINLDNLSCNFGETKFAMSLSANDFGIPDSQKTIMQFKVGNVKTNELDLLWPLFLNHNNVRTWVINHIKDGIIKDGYATMIMQQKGGVEHLQKIESELAFSGLNLEYDKNFPPISNVDGLAYFNDKMMRIDVSKGDVLDSKINLASVTIPDFHARKVALEIEGKMIGAAEDSLKHINYKSEFAKKINQYFSGKAQTTLSIKLPIKKDLELKDAYIKVVSNIENFNNDYISDSNVVVSTLKVVGNNNFITDINLSGANINLKKFKIDKESGVASNIKTILSFDHLGNLYLKKFEWGQGNKNLSGNLTLKTDPLEVTELNLRNDNFGGSDFELNYKVSDNARFVKMVGKSLNISSFIGDHSGDSEAAKHYQKNDIKVSVDEVKLANNQKFRDVKIDINCDLGVCQDGFILAKLSPKKNIEMRIIKPSKKDPTRIKGDINDISIVAKAFDISSQIVDGDAEIKINMSENGKMVGKVEIADGFTVLKNDVVEKISNNDAFSTLKQKIKSSDKIVFDSLKIEFDYQDSVLDINKLIASSYLLGVTTKGRIHTDIGQVDLKGLIVPGYALNKLFGIGRIPVLGQIIVGEEGGGIFAIRYDYVKTPKDQKGVFTINPASAVIPGGIRNVFDLF